MASIYNTNPNELIEKVAEQLKSFEEIRAPSWASFVKTGHSKERPPVEKDWWYIRFAAVLRSIYKLGPVGVSKLRTKYGSKKNRGVRPSHFYRGSGNILRKILQQGEKAGLLKQVEKGVHKGRILTPKGKSLLDKTAASILKDKPKTFTALKPKPAKEAPKQEKPKPTKEEQTPKPAKDSKKEEKPETKPLKQKETIKKTEPQPIKETKKEPKPAKKPETKPKEEPKQVEKEEEIKQVEKEVKEIKEKKKEKETKESKEKTKRQKDKEEVKKVEELVKDIQIKAIKKSKK